MKQPDWVKDAIFYQIFPDRFYRTADLLTHQMEFKKWSSSPTFHGFHGGNLWGVAEKLDYLQDLGVNAIYLNPIFQSASNHRYHTFDFFNVDPLLGGNKAFQYLLSAAHKKKIKVILDGVFNHVGRGFWAFHHLLECQHESPYLDWFHVKNFPINAYDDLVQPSYECWWGLPALPKLNYNSIEVRKYILSVAKHWIHEGIDGWRLDVPNEVVRNFWPEFHDVVKNENPEAYILGEIWADEIYESSVSWIGNKMFDGVMNYGLLKAMVRFFAKDMVPISQLHGFLREGYTSLNRREFQRNIEQILKVHSDGKQFYQMNLLESHDTTRFLWLVKEKKDILKLAYLFLFSYPGAPSLYYGSEWGISGGADPDCRRTIPWDSRELDYKLKDYFKKLIQLRKERVEWRIGKLEFFEHSGSDQLLIYIKKFEIHQTIFILNNCNKEIYTRIPDQGVLFWKCLITGKIFKSQNEHILIESLSAYQGLALQPYFMVEDS